MKPNNFSPLASLMGAALALAVALPAHAVDADAAQALAKKSNCMKCHSVSAKKEGPSFKETATKYKGKADAEQKLVTHLTTNPKIKVDGKEEEHDSLKTKNNAEVLNVAQWILAQ
jgi:cytochrome c